MEVALFFRGKFIPLTDNSRAKSSVRNPRHNKSGESSCTGGQIRVYIYMERFNVSEIHFTNVKKGEYVALIRPTDSTCEPTSNPFIVNDVTCSTWLPKVNAVSLSKSGDVMVTFYPPNSLAKKIEVCMERKGSKGCVHHKEVPTDTQNVTFFNINEGTYKAMLLSHTLGINSFGKQYRVHLIHKPRDGSAKEKLPSNRMPACERVRDETTVKISMSRADAQSEVPPLVPRTKDQKTVFIVYTDHDEHYRGLYIALANALRQLHWTVKMDCLCRSENEGDVIAWTHSTYHVCDSIIVFVSGCLATTCLCDWMSHEKVRDNPSQFDCIAPRVLLKIKARGGKDVVFVSFGTQEEKAYHHDLWTRPIPSTRLAIDDAESEKLRSRSLERTVHSPDRTSCNPGGSSPSSTSPNADNNVALYEISSDEDVRPLLMRFCVDRTAVDDVLDNSLEGIKLKNWFSMKRSKVRASVTTSCRSCRQIALGNVRVPQEHAEIPC
ncbi:hypothetical protein C0Q70_15592 [Pomacea canaliculata]|uniref:Uncharacterized protein n=1 Tax=Pomacea canaliculata TaxID=400727 RepID=A0A2T7NVB3_POMCA|nr:hypothetical protein C0Q70_15592 [Pomacea canaliculata]